MKHLVLNIVRNLEIFAYRVVNLKADFTNLFQIPGVGIELIFSSVKQDRVQNSDIRQF